MWSGTISFGLVSVPVALFPGVRSGRVRMRMLDEDGTPLARRFFCPVEDRQVHPEHIVRGYEVAPGSGEYVTVTDEELESVEPEKSRDIDLRLFVDVDRIDPMHLDRPYYLVPAGGSNKAYRLLAQTMEDAKKAGIATFVMRDKEYLVAIVAEKGILRAQTLRFADELRSPEDIDMPRHHPGRRADDFRKAIASLTQDAFDPSRFASDGDDKLLSLVTDKARRGRDVVESHEEPADADEPSVQSLMAALEASVASNKTRRKKR